MSHIERKHFMIKNIFHQKQYFSTVRHATKPPPSPGNLTKGMELKIVDSARGGGM